MIRLESSEWRVWLDPAQGAQWLAAEVKRGARQWLPVVPDCRQEGAPLDAANYYLLPYSNRIRNGQFVFDGKAVQLQDAASHAIHGTLRDLPWKVEHQTEESLVCTVDSRDHVTSNWPWAMTARAALRLEGSSLISELALTNASDSDMPAGMGWHPYFARMVDGASPELTLPVSSVYPDAAGDGLPDGAAVPIPAAWDFSEPRALDPDEAIDACFAGFAGHARIAWPEAGIALNMQVTEPCRHLIVFNPRDPFFAVEPVSNANDAINLSHSGIDGVGLVRLSPGESLSAELRLGVESFTP